MVVITDEALLACPLLTSCYMAWLLTGHAMVPVHDPAVGDPCLSSSEKPSLICKWALHLPRPLPTLRVCAKSLQLCLTLRDTIPTLTSTSQFTKRLECSPQSPRTPTPPSWPFHIRCSVLSRCLFWIKWWEVLAACCHIYTRRPVDKKGSEVFISLSYRKCTYIQEHSTIPSVIYNISPPFLTNFANQTAKSTQLQSEYFWNTAPIK